MDTLKTLYNVGLNTDTSGIMPKYDVIEKKKEYEIRKYRKNKYAVLKLNTISEGDKGVDSVTNHVWRMMKYTQGENDQNVKMTFHLPVVVQADSSATGDETKADVKIMVTLPIEYQEYCAEDGKSKDGPKEAPKPNDTEILIEVVEEFIGISRHFSGFAKDTDFKKNTQKLIGALESEDEKKFKFKKGVVLCLSYDTPTKLINRRNEVILVCV